MTLSSSWAPRLRVRGALVVGAPLLAVATVALGLHVGASGGVRGALVFASARSPATGSVPLQVHALYEETRVRESLPGRVLEVAAEGSSSVRATATVDGVAEVTVPWSDGAAPKRVTVTDVATGDVLAAGPVTLPAPWRDGGATDPALFAPPTKRDGALAVEVAIPGQRITTNAKTTLAVHVTAKGAPVENATVTAEADQGLSVLTGAVTTCASGWASVDVQATYHLAAVRVVARAKDGRAGSWFGPLVVAPGATTVALPNRVDAGKPLELTAFAPPVRQAAYVEVDGDEGRAFATSLAMTNDGKGSASAPFTVPPLAPGSYWLVTGAEARSAEDLGQGAVARPFRVVAAGAPLDACGDGPALATRRAPLFPKALVLDGFASLGQAREKRRAFGIALAVGALVVGGALEALLLLTGALASATGPRHAETEDEFFDASRPKLTPALAASLALGLSLVLLGFALLAGLVAYRGS